MKKIAVLISLSALFWGTVQAQPGCPSVNAGPDTTLPCGQTCVTLHATVVATGTTNTYAVGSTPYTPPYPYNTGTPILVNTDDIYSGLITLPFNFCFYGNNYSNVVAGSNGVITFQTTAASAYCPWSFTATCPSSSLPLNAVFGVYQDIDPSVSGNMYSAILGTYPCRTYCVSWNQVAMFSSTCNSMLATSQIVLYESTNIIEVYVQSKPLCSSWNSGNALIGIQNVTGTIGSCPPGRNTGQWTANNEAWRFTPNGPSNYTLTWYQGINAIGTGANVNVCPTTNTTYTAEAVYTNCNGNNVTVSDNVVVHPNPQFSVTATPDHPTYCAGGSVVLSAHIVSNGGVPTYSWSPAVGLSSTTDSIVTANPTVSTNYVVTGTAGNCSGTDTVFLTVRPVPTVTATGSVICIGDTGTVSVTSNVGGTLYHWNTGDTASQVNVNPLVTTTYTVVGNAANCYDSTTTTVTVNPLPLIQVNDTAICQGMSAWLTAINGVNFIWDDLSTANPRQVTPAHDTVYYVVGIDANGCKNFDSSNVHVSTNPVIVVEPDSICQGGSTTLTATGANTYIWTPGNSTSNPLVVSPSATQTYSVVGKDLMGCIGSTTATISVFNRPTTAFQPNPEIVTTDNPVINFYNTSAGADSYLWNFGDVNAVDNYSIEAMPNHSFTGAGTFTVWLTAKSAFGCLDSTSRTVIVENPYAIYFPNAFSPNGEGNNEVWIPQGIGIDLSQYELKIFDRWGEVVFTTTNFFEGWNGRKMNVGSVCTQGTYVYNVNLRQLGGLKKHYAGHITLIQ